MSSAIFGIFQPEPDALLRRISDRIDDGMLEEIAAADYGYDAEEHLLHLRRIRDDGSFAIPMRWEPREVLELIRWSQPEDPDWKPGATGERGHWMRAFSCTALLRAAGEIENSELRDGWNSTLIQLIESLRILSSSLCEPAAALLSWLILKFASNQETDECGFFGVGLLWFALQRPTYISDDIIVSLAEWIVAREQQEARDGAGFDGWLLGTTFFNLRHSAWKRLGRALQELDLGDRSAAAQEWVTLIATELSGSE